MANNMEREEEPSSLSFSPLSMIALALFPPSSWCPFQRSSYLPPSTLSPCLSLLKTLLFSLLLSLSLSLQGAVALRSSCSGHPLKTRTGERSSGGADWSWCSSLEAKSRRWRRVQHTWPLYCFSTLYRRHQPHPPLFQGPNMFLSIFSS